MTPSCSFQQDISNVVLHTLIGDHLTFVSLASMVNNQIATLIFNNFFGHNSNSQLQMENVTTLN
jgi:hypothetical protein